jgi:TRAP-type C4-dicarboxylate transport system permease small subunit
MEKSAMGFDFPVYYFTAALPVGFALTALRLTTNIIQTLKGNYNTPPWELSTASGLGGISTKEK